MKYKTGSFKLNSQKPRKVMNKANQSHTLLVGFVIIIILSFVVNRCRQRFFFFKSFSLTWINTSSTIFLFYFIGKVRRYGK